MTDILVQLPQGFRFLNQFAPSQWAKNPSLMLCGETCVTMATEFARPGSHIPEHLIEYLCERWVGPDTRSDPNGTTVAELEAMLQWCGDGYINLQSLVDQYNAGNQAPLHNELMAQNNQDVPQIIAIGDESKLTDITGKPLHDWTYTGSHIIFRIGYSNDQGYGLYGEPAAVLFPQPVKIPWSSIQAAGILHAWAIMPSGVVPPPPGFLFQQGDWPPKPAPTTATLDLTKIGDILNVLKAASNANAQAISEIEAMLS